MFKIGLVNMPFANLHIPSLGLTQLKSVVLQQYGGDVAVDIHYLNHDFAHYMGIQLYKDIIALPEHQNSGIGDWFFRQVAFPELPDNAEEYYTRYYAFRNPRSHEVQATLEQKRQGLDAFLDELIAKYRLDEVDLLGCTSMFVQNVASIALLRKLKERRPQMITVLGGANCEAPMGIEIARSIQSVDFVFSGPALKSFPAFVGHALAGQWEQCERIDGVLSKHNLSLVMSDAQQIQLVDSIDQAVPIAALGQELDINTLIDLDYDSFLVDLKQKFPAREVDPVLIFETSRGCWWGERSHCTFCGLNGLTMSYRAMQPDMALTLMHTLFDRYAEHCRNYICVDNIMPRNYLTEVFPKLAPPPETIIFYEVKSSLSADDLRILSEAGVKIVQPGIESLATSTLKLMGKGSSSFQNIQFLKNCAIYNVYPTWNLLVGFPGEDPAVYEKYIADMPALLHLPPPTGVYPVRFDRYSPYFNRAEHYELDLHPLDYYAMIYPVPKEALYRMSYYFLDRNFDALYFHNMVRWIDKIRDHVDRWQLSWHGSQKALPQLYFKSERGPGLIYDSRTGEALEYSISERARQILDYLARPRKLSDLPAAFSATPQAELDEDLALLAERKLIFQEDDRLMSLILPAQPSATSFLESPIVNFNFDVDVTETTTNSHPVQQLATASAETAVLQKPGITRASRDAHRVQRSSLQGNTSGSTSKQG